MKVFQDSLNSGDVESQIRAALVYDRKGYAATQQLDAIQDSPYLSRVDGDSFMLQVNILVSVADGDAHSELVAIKNEAVENKKEEVRKDLEEEIRQAKKKVEDAEQNLEMLESQLYQ